MPHIKYVWETDFFPPYLKLKVIWGVKRAFPAILVQVPRKAEWELVYRWFIWEMTQEALMKKREWGDREERNTNMGAWNRVGCCCGKHTGIQPVTALWETTWYTVLNRPSGGWRKGVSDWGSVPRGTPFHHPPHPSPTHRHTHFGITPAYLGQAPWC